MDESLKRSVPHSLAAERAVIGSMILDNDAVYVCSEILTKDDFYQKLYGKLFQAIVDLNNSQSAVRIEASGYGLDATGTIVEVKDDIIRSLAPGKQTILDFWMENDENNEVVFTSQIKATKLAYEKDYSDSIAYSMNPTSNSAIVTLTNTGAKTADVTVQALFLYGSDIAYYNYDIEFDMDAGATAVKQIESRDRKFDNCFIFVQSSYFTF